MYIYIYIYIYVYIYSPCLADPLRKQFRAAMPNFCSGPAGPGLTGLRKGTNGVSTNGVTAFF